MKILIATPLYPPDIAGHAPYVKEIAGRLSGMHEITILTYNHIPERIEHVRIVTIPKRLPSLIRIIKFTIALMKAQREADAVFFQNGPSIEIPLIIASLLPHPPYLLRLGDETPLQRARAQSLYRMILRRAISRSHTVMTHEDSSLETIIDEADSERFTECPRPKSRPEILPFRPLPAEAQDAYETSWREHVHGFLNIMATMLI